MVGRNATPTQQFYNGKHIFLTGGTGFLGKILMEKLLRCCRGAEVVFLLVRQKRGKDIYTRVDEIFDDTIFDGLRAEDPKFRHKIVPIPGDCRAEGLGLTIQDRQTLIEKVNIIFHAAATVNLDEQLRVAFEINLRGTRDILSLAKEMKQLDVLMYVSTAYSNSHLTQISERYYPCHTSYEQLACILQNHTDEEINAMFPSILGPCYNTYVLTKALAEQLLREHAGAVPVGIFRPAIVTPTVKEPIPNWIDNAYGPTGILVGVATGVLRTLNCDPAVTAEIVPVDLVINCLLVAAAAVHKAYRESPSPPPEPPIFNYVSSPERRLTWGSMVQDVFNNIDNTPLLGAKWYYSFKLVKSSSLNNVYSFFLHSLPAGLIDMLSVVTGHEPRMLKTLKKINKFCSVLVFFCTREITYCNQKVRELWTATSDEDKELFPFSMSRMQWDQYLAGYLPGLKKYMFKEQDDTLQQAKTKWRRLFILHNMVKASLIVTMLYVLRLIMFRFRRYRTAIKY